jgi:Flp pilus assembly protein TadD
LPEANYKVEFPAHLNFRYWQDVGEVLEHLGERNRSRLAYGMSFLYHPYFVYFPIAGARGNSRVTDQTGCGHTYFQSYNHFFVSGSIYSFGANKLIAMDLAEDQAIRTEIGEEALVALTACIDRGLRPASALALRGQVNYRLFRDQDAVADLMAADAALTRLGRESDQVLKLLAVIHFEHEDYETCLQVLERYNKLFPRDGFGWRTAGVALSNLGRLDEAIVALERAIRVEPGKLEGYFNLGLLYLKTGDLAGADLVQKELEARYPDHPQTANFARLRTAAPDEEMEMIPVVVEIKTSVDESQWFLPGSEEAGLGLLGQMSDQDVKQLVDSLRLLQEDQGTPRGRLLLANALGRLDRWEEVQDLFSGLWPERLTRAEAMLLLQADQHLGVTERAVEMAHRLEGGKEPLPDGEFWWLVAHICREGGAEDEARLATHMARSLDDDEAR